MKGDKVQRIFDFLKLHYQELANQAFEVSAGESVELGLLMVA